MKKIIAILLITLSTNVTLYAQSKKSKRLKTSYIESSILSHNNNKFPTIKWENKDTLKYHIEGKFKFMSKKRWGKFITEISKITKITIIEIDNINKADIKIYFGELNDYFSKYNLNFPKTVINPKFDSFSSRRYNSKQQLTTTSYCIVSSKTKNSLRGAFNLKQLFLKSLGLLGSLKDDFSIYNKHHTIGNNRLSKTDKRIIRIHYDSAIKAGMKVEKVKAVLNTLNIEAILKEKL